MKRCSSDDMKVKRCSQCLSYKRKELFASDNRLKSRIGRICKKCQSEKSNELAENRKILYEGPIKKEKFCPGCNENKSSDKFGKNRRTSDGLASFCKECANARLRNLTILHSEGLFVHTDLVEKLCSRCKKMKSSEHFTRNKRLKSGLGSRCKECVSQIMKDERKAHPEKIKPDMRPWSSRTKRYSEYRLENKEKFSEKCKKYRARKKNSPICDLTEAQWELIKSTYNFCCYYCGKKTKLTQDHITPLSLGGTHSMDNIVPSCLSCNSRKGANPPPVPVQPMLKLGI